jgi:hypothetical protein
MNDQISGEKENFFISIIRKNLKIIIGVVISLLITVIIITLLDYKQKNNNIETSEQFNQARILIVNKDFIEGKKILNKIIEKKNKFYSPLSLYLIIENNLEKDSKKLIELFDEILSNKKIEKENLNLIRFKKAVFLSNFDNDDVIIKTLEPVIDSDSIWREQAIKLLADYFSNKGKNSKADQYFNLLKSQKNN